MEWQQKDEMEYNAIYNDYIKCIVTQELYDENGKDKELWYAHIEINWKYCKEVYSFEDYNYNNDKGSSRLATAKNNCLKLIKMLFKPTK